MKEKLIKTLEPLGYEIYEQGSFTDSKEYPNDFFTFWNYDTEGHGFYDNSENAIIWHFDLNFYSIDPFKPLEVIRKVKELLKSNGFICTGLGMDLATDTPTHVARNIEVITIERKDK